MNTLLSNSTVSPPYFNSDHEALRDTIRRFLAQRVLPFADAWEESGKVPREVQREVLREMGDLGLLDIKYSAEHGGRELDTLSTVILAEELGRCTYKWAGYAAIRRS